MKKFLTLIFLLLSVAVGVNAKTVFVAASGNNTTGNSWTNALTSIPNSGSSAIAAGDSVFVKTTGVTPFSFSQSTANSSAFATKADVNYMGGFDGSETYSSQRAKSDLDNNGIVEPWEFTNATTLSFNSTNNAYGLYINSNTAKRIFDGFTITGTLNVGQLSASTGGNNMIKINNYTSFQNNILSGCTLSAAPNTATANMGYTKGALIFMGQPTTTTGGTNTVDNCLIENNTSTITPTSSQTVDVQQSPFVHIDASNTTGRNILSNCLFRKNQITLDFTNFGMVTPTYNNPRGMIISMTSGSTNNNCIKNLVIHNNSVTFTPKGGTGTTNLGNGGLIFTYNSATTNMDSIINCTVVNNAMMRIGYAVRGGFSNTTQPYHVIANNVLLDNKNDNGSGTISVQNLTINQTPAGSAGTITIANNVANGGTVSATATTNVYGNLNDLSSTNTNAKGSYFSAPTSINGYSTDASVATSRWTIGSSSYLKAKGYSLAYKSDKAGFAFASTPSVGAYEQYTPTISGSTTTLAFTSTYGTASSAQQFSISGTKLYGNLVATAPAGYEVSTNGSSYGATATIARATGNPSATLYLRLKSTNNAGNYNSLNTVLSSTDASSVNISTPASGNTVSPKALTIGTASIASKVYDGNTTSGVVTSGSLSGFVGSETVTVSSAVGTYPDANVGTGKTATIVYTLGNGDNGGLATNYSLANESATGDITAATGSPSGDNLNNSGLTDNQLANTNLTISSGEFIINATKTVRSLTIAPGAKLTHSSGTITATNGITLESDAIGTATLMDSYSTPTINATVKQYLSSARNWYFSPAVSGVTVPASSTYFGYEEAGSNSDLGISGASAYWKPYATGTSLTAGKGYIVQPVAATTLSFTNTTISGDVSPVLTYNSGKGNGYNLVGNPYPSYLSWSAVYDYDFINGKTANMPTGTIWYRMVNYNGRSAWTANTAYSLNDIVYNGTRFYKSTAAGTSDASGGPSTADAAITDNSVTWAYQGSVYVFATISATGVATPSTVNNLIPPMQAFWVKTANGGGTLRFKNSMRSHNSTGVSNALKAPINNANEMPLIRLSVTNGAGADEAVIYANTNANNAFDSYDAPKYFNTAGSNQAEIYSQIGNEKLVINAMNEITSGAEIPLGFVTEETNNFRISATELKNINSDMQVALKDNQLKKEFDLSTGIGYEFSSTAVNDANRFSLLFKSKGTTTGIDNVSKLNLQVFVNAANQIAIIAPEKSNYAIYNAVGQLIQNGILNTNREIINAKHASGVYFVKLSVNGQCEIQKVIIR